MLPGHDDWKLNCLQCTKSQTILLRCRLCYLGNRHTNHSSNHNTVLNHFHFAFPIHAFHVFGKCADVNVRCDPACIPQVLTLIANPLHGARSRGLKSSSAFLLLVAMPLLVDMPFAPSSVLAPSSSKEGEKKGKMKV